MKSILLEELRRSESTKPLRLLLLENAIQDAELTLLELKASGFDVECTIAQDREEFLAALESAKFDAVLADYRLPNWTGLDALKELRDRGKDFPFLLMTGTLGEEAAVECIKQGVSDCILKEHLRRLPSALKRALEEKSLRDENARAHQALAQVYFFEARARGSGIEVEQRRL